MANKATNGRLAQYEVVAILRRQIKEAGSLRAWARAHGVAVGYVSDVVRGRRDPGPKILAVIGFRQAAFPKSYERDVAPSQT